MRRLIGRPEATWQRDRTMLGCALREHIVSRMTATHGPRSVTNWRAPWPCLPFWKPLHRNIRHSWGPGPTRSPQWGTRSDRLCPILSRRPLFRRYSIARLKCSTCSFISSPATTARYALPCTPPPRIKNTETGTGAACRFADFAKATDCLPSRLTAKIRYCRNLAHAGARGNGPFDANRGKLAGTLHRSAQRYGPAGLGYLESLLRRRCASLSFENQRPYVDSGAIRMTFQLHTLKGCSPVPLAHYLKALGILRLVVEQRADCEARGWWDGEHFCLMSMLSREELEAFFLEKYEPTPLLSPWNKGCGFFKANDPGLAPLEQSHAARFQHFREGVTESRRLLDAVAARGRNHSCNQSQNENQQDVPVRATT